MDDFLALAKERRSIRKYEKSDIPTEDIEYFVRAAVNAPSGCNSQCWKFVAIKNKDTIMQIKSAVIDKFEEVLEIKSGELPENYLPAKRRMISFFADAPVVIAVFMTDVQYYDPTVMEALKAHGYDNRDIIDIFSNYDLLSIGAAVQNLLLAVHEKGYGACWMNEPAIAGKEINRILNIPLSEKFISLIPIGVPAYTPRAKKMKEFGEVYKIIE